MRSRPNYENFAYEIVRRPLGVKAFAWAKLEEAERRLALVGWLLDSNDHNNPKFRVELDDAVSAFLMNLEAAWQWLLDQWKVKGLPKKGSGSSWEIAKALPEWDVWVKGLRTLRHFEAHIAYDTGRVGSEIIVSGNVRRVWRLAELDPTVVATRMDPNKPSIVGNEIADWNNLVRSKDAYSILRGGLERYAAIVEALERSL